MAIAALLSLFLAGPLAFLVLVRVCKRPMAAFHRAFTNRITSKFASRLPGFAIVVNIGRNSGRVYRTPVNVFWRQDGVLIALTYGRESGWVSNVLAAGRCDLEACGASYELFSPVVVHDASRQRFPFLVRAILGFINANDYLQLQIRNG
jgi:deazaflavin-dependent oxidoreductase (nitroreductase family)